MNNNELVMCIQNGFDVTENLEKLYLQNTGMIEKIIRKYNGIEDLEDLRQEAYFGIEKAAQLWDSSRGIQFIVYAAYWIHSVVRRYIDDCGSVIRVPAHKRTLIARYHRIKNNYRVCFACDPTDKELCSMLLLSQQQLDDLKKDDYAMRIRSTSEPIGEEGELILEDTIATETDPIEDTIDKIQAEELRAVLWACVDDLEPRQAEVIRDRFQNDKTLQECAEGLGCTYQNVKAIQDKALRELRHGKNVKRLRPYLTDGSAYSLGLRSNGVGVFKRRGSAQERAMILLEEISGVKLWQQSELLT